MCLLRAGRRHTSASPPAQMPSPWTLMYCHSTLRHSSSRLLAKPPAMLHAFVNQTLSALNGPYVPSNYYVSSGCLLSKVELYSTVRRSLERQVAVNQVGNPLNLIEYHYHLLCPNFEEQKRLLQPPSRLGSH